MVGQEGQEENCSVGDPGVKGGQMQVIPDMPVVEQVHDIEVQKVKAEGGLADEEERTPGKDGGDGIRTAEADGEGREERQQQTTMQQDVGGVGDGVVEEEPDRNEAGGCHSEALTIGEVKLKLKFAKSDPGEKHADVSRRGIFESPQPDAVGVASNRANEVIGVEQQIESVGDEADDPEGEEEGDQT